VNSEAARRTTEVILINLLPHREAARRRRRESFRAALGLAALLGVLLAGAASLWFQARIGWQQETNGILKSALGGLEADLKDIAALRAEIAFLRARRQAVEDLQGERNTPVHLLNELARRLPDGVYLTSLRQERQTVTLQGMAQSNERVSELLRRLGGSPWLARPELVEISSGDPHLGVRDPYRAARFTMRVGRKE
jgi:type IV pilus assembly protein PilN